ncbi:beta-ketoacyl-ACP synthase [Aureimonas populi]|uniref:Beta-ketoacyl-ACP synthase n=1 Tax=Aureimonas populi TaxID=1701758 RepID=A0ABW5CMT1_9HYPH|nr:beta-ketoacyl-ACP synthase [Aureimonas populi]
MVDRHDVLITGIGLLSSLGEGVEAHLGRLAGDHAPQPALETERFAPYPVHPLPPVDWSAQIPRKDQRQMETWQRLGVYAAGLALADAGVPADEATRSHVDMIVAAGGGERDPAVDALVLERTRGLERPGPVLNETLAGELRPTLFLAQLSNLMAGNISIVHKVTGSSRTFMGEESAGITALQTAAARIASGQSETCLVGGAFSAERKDLLLNYEIAGILLRDEWRPVFSRGEEGGLVPGSLGVFLVLESGERARARNAPAYARIAHVAGDRGPEARMGERLAALLAASGAQDRELLLLSGATGVGRQTARERDVLREAYPNAALRAFGSVLGHAFEAHFLAGVALGAASLSRGALLAPCEGGEERPADAPARAALVTSVGHARGEGVCFLERSA